MATKLYPLWTDEEKAQALHLWNVEKRTAKEIRAIMKLEITADGLRDRLRRYGADKHEPVAPKPKPVQDPKQPRKTGSWGQSLAPNPMRDEVRPEDVMVQVRPEQHELHMCKWPIGDPRLDNFRFCGRHKVPGKPPYCELHLARAWTSLSAASIAAAEAAHMQRSMAARPTTS